jgi:DNA-binding transcriptional ArsR family regulator
MKAQRLQASAAEAESLMKAMASRPRLMILCERTVTQLQLAVGLAMSPVSQHLAKLREVEMVATRRESQTIYYSLSSPAALRILSTLYEIYCGPAVAAKIKQRRT